MAGTFAGVAHVGLAVASSGIVGLGNRIALTDDYELAAEAYPHASAFAFFGAILEQERIVQWSNVGHLPKAAVAKGLDRHRRRIGLERS